MRIVRPGDPGYDADCRISNARFNYRPKEIWYCESAENVKEAIGQARASGVPVRIRAGGHQHEGMCTADGVILIDLSGIHSIEYGQDEDVWIGAGAALTDVYFELWMKGYLFSGGGCGDVHVGGLTQGGGWGPVARKYGLTCDSLLGVEMVTSKGQIIAVSQDNGEGDRAILWALRGGGGGNFGVITKFRFHLHPWAHGYTDLTLTWGDEQLPGERLEQLVLNWVRRFPRDSDHDLTTYLRVSVVDKPGGDRVVVGGRYLGDMDRARETMNRLLAGQPAPRTSEYQPALAPINPITPGAAPIDPLQMETMRRRLGTLPGYQPGPPMIAEGAEEDGVQADISDTCAGVPLRHKISSGFARPEFDLAAVQSLVSGIRQTTPRPEARQYVSLHCLGGDIADHGKFSAFAFRERNVLLQYQAWWQPHAVHLDTPCISWIEGFRISMSRHTDGAFINFVDRDIPLPEYYKGSLPQLSYMKRYLDPDNFFRFQMSIPLT